MYQGTIVGLLVAMAGYEATQAHALAPPTHGDSAMAYCIVCDLNNGAAFPGKITRALQKGCTLGKVWGNTGQGMLCPATMVGTQQGMAGVPQGVCEQPGDATGNLGMCLTT